MPSEQPVRVRFAPAPSGWLHVGSVRTALFNWLWARHTGGTFIWRIEDTDADRATDESMRSMIEAMRWLGLDWDEGIEVGGPYGPYRQSERADLHRAVVRRLEDAGVFYHDDRSPDELDAWRQQRRDADLPPTVKRDTVPDAEGGTLRLALPATGTVSVHDEVRGEVTWNWANESDPVLVRSNGAVTYPLANATDDLAQGVSLVCRGEDLLSVTPRQLFLYDLLLADGLVDDALDEVGLPARDPSWGAPSSFAHLSMVVGQDRKKLSKRHGSVSIQELARRGFLPETLLNAIALLGWSPRDGRERLDRDEVVEAFSLDQVGASAAAFDVDKLTAFNGERIRDMDPTALAHRLVPHLDGTYLPDGDDGAPDPDFEPVLSTPPSDGELVRLTALVPLVQERMQVLADVADYAPPFFREVGIDESAAAKVFRKAGSVEALEAGATALAGVEWTVEAIEAALRGLTDELGIGFGKVAQPIRVAVTGSNVSPPLFESLAIMDRNVVLDRLAAALPVARAVRDDLR